MPTDLLESWPYFREHPDLIRLDVVEGVTPSDKPPVRIFLGTEDFRLPAIYTYLKLGFEPWNYDPRTAERWQGILERIARRTSPLSTS